ncbi:glycosyltransferase family 1 protein [Rhodococcus tibetensis]|uniref:Glycosyltransferase family 1 protein n=1 Tax=Rhodococcus tibetensis TaxID=2965064 RepID=A0ABT1QGT6_9NOCA|nr:glycosyltransferase family 1 protein [Rhodococcus sp. FXJ9.536]MCQ4120898.1 glycosyltransferase family 1 protein [Rhodococcus sp. FXJ9.536]
MVNLSEKRLVYVAPKPGIGGVGDYADDFAAAARPYFRDVVEYRHDGPGADSLSRLRAHGQKIRALVEETGPKRTIVHCELSGGALVPFWGTCRLGPVPVTATVHDPPRAVWWPLRTKFLAEHKLLTHAVHYPLRTPFTILERRILQGRTLFALTATGARHLQEVMSGSEVVPTALLVPHRPQLPAAQHRPLAVGLFGLVYRGKGFEQIGQLRALLDDDILIRVAGRGTERLHGGPGIEIVGGVDGAAEDAFFASIRMLVLPYGRRTIYGDAYPASAAACRALAYQTPLLCRRYGALTEADQDSGAVVVAGDSADLARAANAVLRDTDTLTRLGSQSERLRHERSADKLIADFTDVWARMN